MENEINFNYLNPNLLKLILIHLVILANKKIRDMFIRNKSLIRNFFILKKKCIDPMFLFEKYFFDCFKTELQIRIGVNRFSKLRALKFLNLIAKMYGIRKYKIRK